MVVVNDQKAKWEKLFCLLLCRPPPWNLASCTGDINLMRGEVRIGFWSHRCYWDSFRPSPPMTHTPTANLPQVAEPGSSAVFAPSLRLVHQPIQLGHICIIYNSSSHTGVLQSTSQPFQGEGEGNNVIPRIAMLQEQKGLFFCLPLPVPTSGGCGEPQGCLCRAPQASKTGFLKKKNNWKPLLVFDWNQELVFSYCCLIEEPCRGICGGPPGGWHW